MSFRTNISRLLARLAAGTKPTSRGRSPALTAERWNQIQEVLAQSLERPPEERSGFLRGACGSDAALRAEAESLLAAHGSAGPLDRLGQALRDDGDGGLEAGSVIGHFRLLAKLGQGGMGVVYRAHDTKLDRTVALKFLPRHLSLDEVAKQRFLLEAQSAAALDHPNICTIHEIGETDDGRMYITMPYYGGESLEERLRRGPLPLDSALDIAVQTARGLQQAHEHGVVHRDIKAANLIVTEEGVAKILDFGIAKVADVNITSAGLIIGTPHYMSPEQANGEPADPRSDLWSLGVVLYQMLLARRPFNGPRVESILSAILTDEPDLPTPDTPGAAATHRVISRLLAKDPDDRYPTAQALIGALEEALATVRETAGQGGSATAIASWPTRDIAPGGERRQVTAVVGRIAEYPKLAERLAPEELRVAVDDVHAIVREIVEARGGTVNEVTNAEFVCLFGVPTTHEDDCIRAVGAALEICARRRETTVRVQAGVGSGVIVVQPALRDGQPYAVAGQALDLATLLAAHAEPGDVLLGPECERLVAGYYDTQSGSALTLPERAEPLAPRRVLRRSGATTRFEAATRTTLTPFIGREREREVLEGVLREALGGVGRFASIFGEAGVGKSRLVYEFLSRLGASAVKVVRGHCQPEARLPYLPLVEAVRDMLDLGPDAAPADGPAAITSRVQAIAPELDRYTALYLHLLSVPSEAYRLPPRLQGDQLGSAIREAIAALLTSAAAGRPVLALFEDWHWADAASHQALEALAELAPNHPLLVIVTYRPGYEVRWSEALSPVSLELAPLEAEASADLIRSVLRADGVPEAVRRALHERTGGNPFFLEELCHTLVEQGALTVANGEAALDGGVESLHLPGTVQGVIRTRLDRLDAGARETVRVAAVIGRDFSVPVLERVLGATAPAAPALTRLKELALIRQVRVVPVATFRFKHALTQEVAYDTLLQHQRQALHRRAGNAIEALVEGPPGEHAEVLAHHFGRAEEWRKAVRYGREAATRAQAVGEFAHALEMLNRVERAVLELPDEVERHRALVDTLLQQERLCETLGLRGRQREILARLLGLLESAGDSAQLAEVYRRQGDLHTLLNQFRDAESMLDRALALDREHAHDAGERRTLVSLGMLYWFGGRSRQGLGFMERALEISQARGDKEDIAHDLHNLGAMLRDVGEYERSLRVLQKALRIAEEAENSLATPHILSNIANVYRRMGDTQRAHEILVHSLRAMEETGLERSAIETWFFHTEIAHRHLEEGQIDESLAAYREAVELARRGHMADHLAQSLRILGEVLVGLERGDEALPHLHEAASLFAQLENAESEAATWAKVAQIHERCRRPSDASAAWDTLLGLARRLGDPRRELQALEGRARALRTRGALEEARDAYHDVLRFLARHFASEPEKEADLHNSLGILEWRRGAYAEAQAHYERALERSRATGSAPGIGLALNSLGATLAKLGRADDARARLEEAIGFNREAGQRQFEGHGLSLLGDLHYESGRYQDAVRCYRDSLGIRQAIGDRRGEGWMCERLARTARAAGDDDGHYAQLLARAREIAAQLDDDQLMRACETPSRT